MNKIVLIGRLTKDPELRFTPGNGTAVANFTLAVNRRFKTDGQQEADFIPIVVWGKQAESTANYMKKGSQIGITGRIQTRNYENKEGNRVYTTEVVAEEVQFLDSKQESNATAPQGQEKVQMPSDFQPVDNEQDIPF
ncbi:single-stranded DNA-binding protein [Clostridium niameyense]|uniref:Single-stranded DNA-binding protein n=1 Tax=Clostridium niameyense TaxID=1622073 RepID=A0A6M0RC27_9CLOT|nr:single-stranded DNA-binding protein [Clostridium niameyense]